MKHLPELRTVQCFATVVREGNVTRAAKILNLSQPAVTQQLKNLSERSGLTLFRRTAKGLELTADGAALAQKAEQVLAVLDEFRQTARDLSGQIRGSLRVGTILDPESIRLGALFNRLVQRAPGIRAEVTHGMSGNVPERILRDELDAGFFLGNVGLPESLPSDSAMPALSPVTRSSAPGPDLRSATVTSTSAATPAAPVGATGNASLAVKPHDDARPGLERFHRRVLTVLNYRVIAPPGWEQRLAGRGWSELAALPWIGTPAASAHSRLLEPLFAGLGVRQNIVTVVDQEPSMLAMVQSGVGLSLCRDSIALNERQARGMSISETVQLQTTLEFICLEHRRQDPLMATVYDMLERIWDGQ